jgi:hypothetical protein
MTPNQLNLKASSLDADAASLKMEMDNVNNIIQFLKTTHVAPRLTKIYGDWDNAYNTEFVQWEQVVRDFATFLKTTATNMINAQIE